MRIRLFLLLSLLSLSAYGQAPRRSQNFLAREALIYNCWQKQNYAPLASMLALQNKLKTKSPSELSVDDFNEAVEAGNKINSLIRASKDPAFAPTPLWFEIAELAAKIGAGYLPKMYSGLGPALDFGSGKIKSQLKENEQKIILREIGLKMENLMQNSPQLVDGFAKLQDQNKNWGQWGDSYLSAQVGMNLSLGYGELCKRSPEFCTQKEIQHLTTLLAQNNISQEKLIELSAKIFESLNEERHASSKANEANDWDHHFNAAHTSLRIIGHILSRGNPKLGQDFSHLSAELLSGIKNFDHLKKLIDNPNISPAEYLSYTTLLAEMGIGFIFRFIDLFSKAKPSPSLEKILLDQIADFRTEFSEFVDTNRILMGELDSRMIQVYESLQFTLNDISQGQIRLESQIQEAHQNMARIQQKLLYSHHSITQNLEALAKRDYRLLLKDCIRDSNAPQARLSYEQFLSCERRLRLYVSEFSTDSLSVGSSPIHPKGLDFDRFLQIVRDPLKGSLAQLFHGLDYVFSSSKLGLQLSPHSKSYLQLPNLYLLAHTQKNYLQFLHQNSHYIDPKSIDILNVLREPLLTVKQFRNLFASNTLEQLSRDFQESLTASLEKIRARYSKVKAEHVKKAKVDFFSSSASAQLSDLLVNSSLRICSGKWIQEKVNLWKANSKEPQNQTFSEEAALLTPFEHLSKIDPTLVELKLLGVQKGELCVEDLSWSSEELISEEYFSIKKDGSIGKKLPSPYSGLPYLSTETCNSGGETYECEKEYYSKEIFIERSFYKNLILEIAYYPENQSNWGSHLSFRSPGKSLVYKERYKATATVRPQKRLIDMRHIQTQRLLSLSAGLAQHGWGRNGFGQAPEARNEVSEIQKTLLAIKKRELLDAFQMSWKESLENPISTEHFLKKQLEAQIHGFMALVQFLYPKSFSRAISLRQALSGEGNFLNLAENFLRQELHDIEDLESGLTRIYEKSQGLLDKFVEANVQSIEASPIVEGLDLEISLLQTQITQKNSPSLNEAETLLINDVQHFLDHSAGR